MYIIYVNNTLPLALAVHKISRHFWVAYGLTRQSYCTVKNAQVATSLLTSCKNLLQQAVSHGLQQLADDKSVASCQQICCKLIVKTCYPQACCKLFQQVVTSLQMTCCNLMKLGTLRFIGRQRDAGNGKKTLYDMCL